MIYLPGRGAVPRSTAPVLPQDEYAEPCAPPARTRGPIVEQLVYAASDAPAAPAVSPIFGVVDRSVRDISSLSTPPMDRRAVVTEVIRRAANASVSVDIQYRLPELMLSASRI